MLAKLKSAVQSRNDLLVQQILQHKPCLDSQEGGEILWQAVLDDEIEIASMLVRAGADLSICKPGCILKRTLLHVLSASLDPRHHRLAVLMLDYGADVNARDVHTNGVLYYAIREHNSAIGFIEELLNRGSHVILDIIAMAIEHPLATKLLPLIIEAGNPDEVVRQERIIEALLRSSLYRDNESEILPVVRILLDMNVPMDKNCNVILFNAIQNKKIQMVKLLIARGLDVTAKYKNGHTVIHTACDANLSIDMIKLLVLHGADFNAVGSDGVTPFSRIWQFRYRKDKTEFVIKQLAISIAKNVSVNRMDLNCIKKFSEMTKFYEECVKELELMKLTTVFKNLTLFSCLYDGFKYLAFMIRNDAFVQCYKDSWQKSDFPIFYEDLDYVFEAAEERKNELLEKEEAVRDVLKEILPCLPLEKIIYYMYMIEN